MTAGVLRIGRSGGTEVEEPMDRVVATVFRDRVKAERDTDFVKCGAEWLTYGELDARSDRIAAGLAGLGVRQGDRVAVILPNRQETIELFFACVKLGAVQVPLNYWLKGDFLRYQIADCSATVLVADAAGYRAAAGFLSSTDIRQVVLVDDVDPAPSCESVQFAALAANVDAPPQVETHPNDPVSIIYTSGTTGLPKGCVVPNGAFVASGRTLSSAGWVQPGDRIFTAFPLFHTSGQIIALMSALTAGASVCFEAEFSASRLIGRAAEEQATVIFGVGPMGMALLATPESPADREHTIRLATLVPLPYQAQAALEERFGFAVTGQTYGQTECQPVSISPVGEGKASSAGRAADNFEVRVVDDHDDAVPVGEVGEIVVRPRHSDVMFQGYWNKPTATVEASRNLWHHTGDYGRLDQDGYLFFVDRKKDALRRRGENISSMELEAAIRVHPCIDEVAVCAVPSPLGEDDVKACIVLAPGAQPEPAELFEFFEQNLPYFAIPRYIALRDTLPVSALGRVMKHVLRADGVDDVTWDFEALGLSVAKSDRR